MSEFLSTRSYVGTRDFYPKDMQLRNWFFTRIREVAARFNYQEYQGPILEPFELFAAKSGEELVREQVYHFHDKGERHLAVRPEMTPTVARMVAAQLNELRLPLRWFSIANFMRYERPQKGRLREFYQLNVDLLGVDDNRADIEIMLFIIDLMAAFGADSSMFQIRINNRRFFNAILREVLGADESTFSLISRAIDKRAKVPADKYQAWLSESGLTSQQIADLDAIASLDFQSLAGKLPADAPGVMELQGLFSALEKLGLSSYFCFDFTIVRGLEYYTGTVFEVFDLSGENRRAMFGGGRYDNLVGLFRKEAVSGIGFGMGDVVFQDFLNTHGLIPEGLYHSRSVLLTVFEEVPHTRYLELAAFLRKSGLSVEVYLGTAGKLKKQLQYAEKEGYPFVIVMGEEEEKNKRIQLKDMSGGEQQDLTWQDAADYLKKKLI